VERRLNAEKEVRFESGLLEAHLERTGFEVEEAQYHPSGIFAEYVFRFE
jgi:hypothetical protein